jgi:hypothetical protein
VFVQILFSGAALMKKHLVFVSLCLLLTTLSCSSPKNEPTPPTTEPGVIVIQGKTIELDNRDSNSDKKPWNDVRNFLIQDKLNESYRTGDDTLDLAVKLHNVAEYAGFKTALVVAEAGENQIICNAFDTLDNGIIYVTSGIEPNPDLAAINDLFFDSKPLEKQDAVVFLQEGMAAGFAGINQVQHFDYAWFNEKQQRIFAFREELRGVREQMEECHTSLTALENKDLDPGEMAKKVELTDLLTKATSHMGVLKTEWETLKGFIYPESSSGVTSIQVYW